VMDEIVWGSKAKADAYTARVRTAHAKVAGDPARRRARSRRDARTPPTTPSCCSGSSPASSTPPTALPRLRRPAHPRRARRLWQDYRVVGRVLRAGPGRHARRHRGLRRLHRGDHERALGHRAATRARAAGSSSRCPSRSRVPLREAVNQLTVGLLPARVRRGYGLRWDPARASRSGQPGVRAPRRAPAAPRPRAQGAKRPDRAAARRAPGGLTDRRPVESSLRHACRGKSTTRRTRRPPRRRVSGGAACATSGPRPARAGARRP
jgi:uncharacterized protein (DUF2236 family)